MERQEVAMRRGRYALRVLPGLLMSALIGFGAAHADSWAPHSPKRTIDATGKRYVVVRELAGERNRPKFWLVESAAPVAPAKGDEAKIRPTDTVIAEGRLPMTPVEEIVLPDGRGFVVIDQYANLGYDDIVIFVAEDGAVGVRKTLEDVFTEKERKGFMRSVSSIWWRTSQWYDAETDELFLVTSHHVKAIRRTDGRVRDGDPDDVLRALHSRSTTTILGALDAAKKLPAGRIVEPARQLARDEAKDTEVRLRAIEILIAHHALGDDTPEHELVRSVAFGSPDSQLASEVRALAVELSGPVLGAAALSPLEVVMDSGDPRLWSAAQTAFASIGKPAIETLVRMLRASNRSADLRGGAAMALGKLGAIEPVPALVETAADPKEYVANAALNAAIDLGGCTIAEDLADLLRRGNTQELRLAGYFKTCKHAAAPRALIVALERNPERLVKKTLLEALRYQTDRDEGDDPAAWRKALGLGD